MASARLTRVLFYLWLPPAVVTFVFAFHKLAWPYLISRPPSASAQKRLFRGVTYQRFARSSPAMVWHVATVDLTDEGVSFLVTPPTPTRGRALAADTTSGFLRHYRLQLAINGDFFHPWAAKGPLFYYPRISEPVDVRGYAVSRGLSYGNARPHGKTLFVGCGAASSRPVVSFTQPRPVCHAISGMALIRAGVARASRSKTRHPRTAIGLDREEKRLFLLVVDGRQPGYSEGATMAELAVLMQRVGAHDAIALDGGGSSVMVVATTNGPRVLSSPIHGRIVGWERPVANHFGVYAPPLGAQTRKR